MVETPVKLNAVQKEHLRKFQTMLEQDTTNHNPKSKRWFDGITRFFKDVT